MPETILCIRYCPAAGCLLGYTAPLHLEPIYSKRQVCAGRTRKCAQWSATCRQLQSEWDPLAWDLPFLLRTSPAARGYGN